MNKYTKPCHIMEFPIRTLYDEYIPEITRFSSYVSPGINCNAKNLKPVEDALNSGPNVSMISKYPDIISDYIYEFNKDFIPDLMDVIINSKTFKLVPEESQNKIIMNSVKKCSMEEVPKLINVISNNYLLSKTDITFSCDNIVETSINKCPENMYSSLTKEIIEGGMLDFASEKDRVYFFNFYIRNSNESNQVNVISKLKEMSSFNTLPMEYKEPLIMKSFDKCVSKHKVSFIKNTKDEFHTMNETNQNTILDSYNELKDMPEEEPTIQNSGIIPKAFEILLSI